MPSKRALEVRDIHTPYKPENPDQTHLSKMILGLVKMDQTFFYNTIKTHIPKNNTQGFFSCASTTLTANVLYDYLYKSKKYEQQSSTDLISAIAITLSKTDQSLQDFRCVYEKGGRISYDLAQIENTLEQAINSEDRLFEIDQEEEFKTLLHQLIPNLDDNPRYNHILWISPNDASGPGNHGNWQICTFNDPSDRIEALRLMTFLQISGLTQPSISKILQQSPELHPYFCITGDRGKRLKLPCDSTALGWDEEDELNLKQPNNHFGWAVSESYISLINFTQLTSKPDWSPKESNEFNKLKSSLKKLLPRRSGNIIHFKLKMLEKGDPEPFYKLIAPTWLDFIKGKASNVNPAKNPARTKIIKEREDFEDISIEPPNIGLLIEPDG